MTKVNIIFTFDGVNSIMQYSTDDNMKDICLKYSQIINQNIDFLSFLYEGNMVNFELNFKSQANFRDKNRNEMKILVYKRENYISINNDKNNLRNNLNSNNKKILLLNIKTIYFIRIIFFHLDEKIKLKIVKYNKYMQTLINISIIHYKFFSGRYTIYNPNREVKEFVGFSNKLKYEGGYLNGQRNGKGKEYDYDGNLIFEGEYLNGQRNGKGKEFNLMAN